MILSHGITTGGPTFTLWPLAAALGFVVFCYAVSYIREQWS